MEYYAVVYTDDKTLRHHGIGGQKWYERRFQYEDGSLTPAGRERYLKGNKREEKRIELAEQKKHAEQLRKDSANSYKMSDSELRAKIQRLQLEKQLSDLTDQQVNRGRMYVSNAGKELAKTMVSSVVAGGTMYLARALITGDFDTKQFAEQTFKINKKK